MSRFTSAIIAPNYHDPSITKALLHTAGSSLDNELAAPLSILPELLQKTIKKARPTILWVRFAPIGICHSFQKT